MSKLTLNTLNFSHTQQRITVYLSTNRTENCIRLSEFDCNDLEVHVDEDEILYCTLEQVYPDQIVVSKPVNPEYCVENEKPWSLSFLKKYYTLRLTHYFRSMGIPATNNFVSDTEVWIKDTSALAQCAGYRVFTLRVQFRYPGYQPELLIAMGDIHSVHTHPVTDTLFTELSEGVFKKVMYQDGIYRYDKLPPQAKRHLEEVFPCISNELLYELKITRPAPDKSNRYIKFRTEIEKFSQHYLRDAAPDFMQLADKWNETEPEMLDVSSFGKLQFGEGEDAEPKYGFKKFGPKELMEDEVVFFFIMHQDDIPFAFTINEFLSGKQPDFQGGLSGFLRMKYNTEPHLSIIFGNKNNTLVEIEKKLKTKKFDSSKRYVAIYLSPHSKWTRSAGDKNIYYRLKELLLSNEIVSQTIEVDKLWGAERQTIQEGSSQKAVLKGKFQFSLPNILVAIYAKLGYTPWCFEKQPTEELVVGISAYRSKEMQQGYMGSAFSFTNEGRFRGFDCLRSNQINELAGLIALTVKEYCEEQQNPTRLVIHFYKRLSRREIKPIEKVLSQLGLKIPVLIVSVNKGYADDIVAFDDSRPHKMPLSGSFITLSNQQYLLFNNQLQTGEEKINEREGYPFPLKLTIQKYLPGINEVKAVEKEEAEQLMIQVSRFSQLYWKSVSRQWMPVTLRYPEMLAEIVPRFNYMDLKDMGRSNLWFL